MAIQLENQQLSIVISKKGAELSSIRQKVTGIEYLWQGDPAYWGRKAPVLFPIVGRLKEDKYEFEGKTYQLGQHGFARDLPFEVLEKTGISASFRMSSNSETKKRFPFDFVLVIRYELEEQAVKVTYQVENPSNVSPLFFSIGGHPGFNVPIIEGTVFEDYYLNFSPKRTRTVIPMSGPYLDLANKTLAQTNTDIALSYPLFDRDALIYETKKNNTFSIQSDKTDHSVSVQFEDFPYAGVWSPPKKEAPFVCIEPWFGLADALDANGQLNDKLGIQTLGLQQTFKADYTISVT